MIVIKTIGGAALAIALAGCSSIIHPVPDRQSFAAPPGADQTFVTALELADNLDEAFEQRRQAMEQWDFWTGTGLFGVSLVGLGFGLFDASRDALLGATAAVAGLAGIRAFVPFSERRLIYAEGQKAIACAVTSLTFTPPAFAPRPEA